MKENTMKENTTEEPKLIETTLLSVDAIRDYEGGWNWNAWYTLEGGIFWQEGRLSNTRVVLNYLRKMGYLTQKSKGRVRVDDDGYNVVIEDRNTGEPLLALCYGMHTQYYDKTEDREGDI